jgi:hypothetical protein
MHIDGLKNPNMTDPMADSRRPATLVATAILASAIIGKSGLSYFFKTSGGIHKHNIDKLKNLIKELDA